jgi:two-component system response regulator ChvI
MLIDDEKDILRVIKRGLELGEDYSKRSVIKFIVDTYRDTESALRSFREQPAGYYNLIITDLRMTKSGFELYRVMKEKSPDLKFAFLTAYDTIDKQQFANYLSDIDPSIFITKPITISKLRQRLIDIIDK